MTSSAHPLAHRTPLSASLDLLVVAVLAIAGVDGVLFFNTHTPLRPILTLPVVLILPGYALLAALCPPGSIGAAQRAVFALAASLAASALSGLALNLTPWGLQPRSWVLSLAGLTLLATAVALARRSSAPPLAYPRLPRPGPLGAIQISLVIIALLLVVGAGAVATYGETHQPTPGFTQLWALPQEVAGQRVLQVGIANHERRPMRYLLRATVHGTVVQRWGPIPLKAGQKWEQFYTVGPVSGRTPPVRIALARAGHPGETYRYVDVARRGIAP